MTSATVCSNAFSAAGDDTTTVPACGCTTGPAPSSWSRCAARPSSRGAPPGAAPTASSASEDLVATTLRRRSPRTTPRGRRSWRRSSTASRAASTCSTASGTTFPRCSLGSRSPCTGSRARSTGRSSTVRGRAGSPRATRRPSTGRSGSPATSARLSTRRARRLPVRRLCLLSGIVRRRFLDVMLRARNVGTTAAPVSLGWHPYLRVPGHGTVDALELTGAWPAAPS